MNKAMSGGCPALLLGAALAALPTAAQNVKITPLGSHDGEFLSGKMMEFDGSGKCVAGC